MLQFLIILIIAINAAFSESQFFSRSFLNGRIVGGVQVNISEIPYQVSIQYDNKHDCGGSLIAKNFVLTAAHCTENRTTSSFKVRIGSSEHDNGGILVQVTELYNHPKYNSTNVKGDYDFSIFKLNDYSNEDITVGYVKLQEPDETIADGTIVRVSGWGDTLNSQESDCYLRAVNIQIINQDICKYIYPSITERMICAGVNGNGSYRGDSGGPLAINNKLIGVVSWGDVCASDPGVYARVSSVRDWIRKVSGV